MAKTYKLKLSASTPYGGCESTEMADLSDYGFSDEEWDGLTVASRNNYLNDWAEEYFWNEGYEYGAEIERG